MARKSIVMSLWWQPSFRILLHILAPFVVLVCHCTLPILREREREKKKPPSPS